MSEYPYALGMKALVEIGQTRAQVAEAALEVQRERTRILEEVLEGEWEEVHSEKCGIACDGTSSSCYHPRPPILPGR